MQERRTPGIRGIATTALVLAAALVLGGCFGSVSREEFDAEIQARGGGFSERSVLDVVDDLARRLGTDDLAVRSFSVSPASGTVVTEVRDPSDPRNLDRYVYSSGRLVSSEPVQLSASDDLDLLTVPLTDFALDALDEMVEVALAEYDVEGGYVDGVRLRWSRTDTDIEMSIAIGLQSPRSTAEATFTADGELLGVELR